MDRASDKVTLVIVWLVLLVGFSGLGLGFYSNLEKNSRVKALESDLDRFSKVITGLEDENELLREALGACLKAKNASGPFKRIEWTCK